MGHISKNKIVLFITCIFSFFAVTVAGISTFARFQQTFAPTSISQSVVNSGSADLTIDGVTGYKYVYDDTGNGLDYNSGHVASYGAYGTDVIENISQDSEADGNDVPLEGVGYYCLGDEKWAVSKGNGKMPWTFASAVRLEDKYGENKALLRNTLLSEDEKIEFYHYYFSNGSTSTSELLTVIESDDSSSTYSNGRITIGTSGYYNIWINKSNKICIDFLRPVENSNSLAAYSKGTITKKAFSSYNSKVVFLQNNWNCSNIQIEYRNNSGNNSGNINMLSTNIRSNTYTMFVYGLPSDATGFKIHYNNGGTNRTSQNITEISSSLCYYFNYDDSTGSYDLKSFDFSLDVYFRGGSFGWGSTSSQKMAISTNFPTDTYLQYEFEYIASAGDEFKLFYSSGGDHWYGYDDKENDIDTTFFTRSNDGNFIISKNATIKAFLKFKKDGSIKIWVDNPVFYKLHVIGKKFNVAAQSHNNTLIELGNSFDYETKTNTLLSITDSTLVNETNFSFISKYDSPQSFSWYVDSDLSEAYDGTKYSSNANSPLDLYAGAYTEKTVKIYFYNAKRSGTITSTSSGVGTLGAYNVTNLNISKGVTNPSGNSINWGVTGSFRASNFVSPSISEGYSIDGAGWGTSSLNDSTSVVYDQNGGTTIVDSINLYYKTSEDSITVSYEYRFFMEDGTSFSNNNLSTTCSYTSAVYPSQGNYLPAIDIQNIAFTDNYAENSLEGVSGFYIFNRANNNVAYTDQACTTPYSGPITAAKAANPLYIKMQAEAGIQLFVRKPDQTDNGVKSWSPIKAHVFKNSTVCTSGGSSTIDYVQTNYIKTKDSEFFTFIAPLSCKIYLTNNGSFTDSGYKKPNVSKLIDLSDSNSVDDEGKKRGSNNTLQLYGGADDMLWATDPDPDRNECFWKWTGCSENKYYLVGENLTDNTSFGNDWSDENGIEMIPSTDSSYIPGQIAFARHVYLSNDVIFKIHNSLGNQWLGSDDLKTGQDEETVLYVESVGNGSDNIKMTQGTSGYFNIYIDKSRKIHVEDAEKAAYMFFTDVVGPSSSTSYKMGSGDDIYTLAIYEQGISLRAGDTMAIRNRRRGTYDWYAYDHLDSNYSDFVETDVSKIPLSQNNQLGDGTGTPSHMDSGKKLIKFTKDGIYKFYLKIGVSRTTIVIEEIVPQVSYGYYIKTNSSGLTPTSLTVDGATQLRTVNSGGANIAVYSGFHVTSSTKYSLFSIRKEGNSEIKTGYTNFYDDCEHTYGASEAAFSETKDNYTYSGNYVTLNPGYYNIYIRKNIDNIIVSFTKFNYGGFFAMNSIQYGVNTENGVYNSHTSLVLRVAFTVKNNSSVSFGVSNIQIGDNSNGLHSFLKYSFILDPVGIDSEENPNPYESIRETYFDNLKKYTASPTLELQHNGDDTFEASAANGNKHYLYILIDYDYEKLRDENEALTTDSQKERDFYFVLKTTQN